MAIEKTGKRRRLQTIEGWLVHKRPLRETSLQVFFFTREYGLFDATYRGGRAPKKQSFLQALTPVSLSVDAVSDRYYIRSVESLSAPLPLQGAALFASLYLNELIFYVLGALDPVPALYQVYVDTLEGLQGAEGLPAIEVFLRRFEWALLTACGQKTSLTHVAYSEDRIQADKRYCFVAHAGFMPDASGLFPGEDILALSKGDFGDSRRLRLAKLMARQAIDGLLGGKVLRTRQLFSALP